MHFTNLALLSQDEVAIAKVLRENNRFNDMLAKLEAAGSAEQSLLEQIRSSQDDAMAVVADIANAIRDGNLGAVTGELLRRQERLDDEISARVGQLVEVQQDRMTRLRDSVAAANRESLILTSAFAVFGDDARLDLRLRDLLVFHPSRTRGAELSGPCSGGQLWRTHQVFPIATSSGALADRMNHMSEELQRFDKEQRRAAAELGRLNEQLAQTSKAKSEFLANMSHELRTPMNAILGFTEMLLDGLYGDVPAALKEPLTDIQVNGRHLLRLINDVLDLSKIEAGRMELALGEYSVREVIDIVHVSLRSLAAEKGLEFATSVPDDLPVAYGDNRRLTQCLMNLAGNAIKFTKQGRVEIGVELAGDELVYRVADTGMGIPKEELENVFAEFRQVDATVTREFGGTGLGLSITKKFVEMHGGRIWVESELGKGCTFFFAVPLRAKGEEP